MKNRRGVFNVAVEQVEFHRNGVGGRPFHVVLFLFTAHAHDYIHKMVGIVPYDPQPGECFVLDVEQLKRANIDVGNTWRGDDFEPYLLEAIADTVGSKNKDRLR